MPALNATRSLLSTSRCSATTVRALRSSNISAKRQFCASQRTLSASGHEDHYDPPTGWLWGVAPGQKYQKEGWEGVFIWGFFGSLGIAAIAYGFKPDTSIQTWALEEARRRLEAEGILEDPDSKSS